MLNENKEQEYSIQEQEYIKNINKIDLYYLLRKEKLSFNFIVNYINNEKYQKTRKEKSITLETIINYQPHFYELIKNDLK